MGGWEVVCVAQIILLVQFIIDFVNCLLFARNFLLILYRLPHVPATCDVHFFGPFIRNVLLFTKYKSNIHVFVLYKYFCLIFLVNFKHVIVNFHV